MPEELNERERLVKEFKDNFRNSQRPAWDVYADLVIADRKKVLEEIGDAIYESYALNKNMVEAAEFETLEYFSEYRKVIKLTEEALSKIKELMGEV